MQLRSIAQDALLLCIADDSATLELISEHVGKGASLEARNPDDDNVLHIAAQQGALASLMAIMAYLKKQAASSNTTNTFSAWIRLKRFSNDPDLPIAALDLLLAQNKHGLTPMHQAAASGHEECVRFLAATASTHSIPDKSQQSALVLASRNGHLSTAVILISFSADLYFKGKSGAQPLHFAALSGHAGLVQFMLDKSVPVLLYDGKGRLPSCYAAKKGSVETLRLLHTKGDQLNGELPFLKSLIESGRETPIKYAAKAGHADAMRFLFSAKVDVNHPDRKGLPPIYHAAKSNQTGAVELLVQNGADFQHLTKEGELPVLLVENQLWKQRFWQRYGMSSSTDTYMYACLCYMSSFSHPVDKLDLTDKSEIKIFQDAGSYLADQGWQRFSDCLEMCADNPSLLKAIEEHHYYGIIYCRENEEGIEFVVAHRGTDLGSTPNLVADGQILGREMPALFMTATLPFVEIFLAKIGAHGEMRFNQKSIKSITHVGFSLGGFAAAAAAGHTLSRITFAKTFDAPGIDYLFKASQQRALAQHVVNYVALPNLVNTCNAHVGPVYQLSTVAVDDGRQQQHDVRFEVPGTVVISHFLSTAVRHNLSDIIAANQQRKELHLRQVSRWPKADIKLIYGPFPRDDSYQLGLLNAIGRLAKTLLKKAVWQAMQRQTEDGQLVGLIAVRHRCDYTIEYACKGTEDAQLHLQNNL